MRESGKLEKGGTFYNMMNGSGFRKIGKIWIEFANNILQIRWINFFSICSFANIY